jgi:hypothetical protein
MLFLCIKWPVFQMTYTSLFGFFNAYIFARTGSLLAVTLSHAFCNIMGFPSFDFTSKYCRYKEQKNGNYCLFVPLPHSRGDCLDSYDPPSPTIVIIIAFFIGISAFSLAFSPVFSSLNPHFALWFASV